MPKAKTEGVGTLSKSEKAKLQRLYKEGKAAFGSVRNLQKASVLSRSKIPIQNTVKQLDILDNYLHLQSGYMKFGDLI